MFYKISSSVGSGKTQAVIEHIRDNLDSGYIIVAPTVQLCSEIYERQLERFAYGDVARPEYTSGDRIRLVVNGDNMGPVFPRALKACQDFNSATPPIIIVTTVTFEFLLQTLTDEIKQLFKVFIDEGMHVIKTEQLHTSKIDEFRKHFEVAQDGLMTPAHGAKEVLDWIAFKSNKLATADLQHFQIPAFEQICRLVVTEIYDAYLDTTSKSFRVVGVLSPETMKSFKSVTMIVAVFDATLLPILWKQKHGIEFAEFPLEQELFDSHKEKGPQISIWHVLHPDDVPSVKTLRRNWKDGQTNENDPKKRVIQRIGQIVDAAFPNGAYCWSANNFFKNEDNVMQGTKMPPVCAGLNQFRHHQTVVSLLCMNPQPWVPKVLVKLFDLARTDLYELWRFSHTYQVIGRCRLRVRNDNLPITIVVLSKQCADKLRELFIGSDDLGQLGDLPKYSSSSPIEETVNKIAYSRRDDSAYSKHKKRANDSGTQPLDKEVWYNTMRLPSLQKVK